jgi:hypothetical protein
VFNVPRARKLYSSAARPVHYSGSELVVLVLEQDVERRQRSVTARDILLQIQLVRFAQFAWHAVASAGALHKAPTTASVVGEPVTVQYVLDMGCRWKPCSTLTVAFSGGTPDLRPKIETPARNKCLVTSGS